jgi:cadmium resistance protein CadD (predicted permease)
MKTIEADLQRETALKALLQQEEAIGPAFSFTANVMSQIVADKQAAVYKPIITRKAWYGIAAMMVVFFMLIFASNTSTQNTAQKNWLVDTINYTHAIPPIYLMALVIVVVLLLADYLLTRLKGKTQAI